MNGAPGRLWRVGRVKQVPCGNGKQEKQKQKQKQNQEQKQKQKQKQIPPLRCGMTKIEGMG
jgi:hypothetical protein